jgi:hypothetical protein
MDDRDHDLPAGPPPIPILTGCLGVGKTTRLHRLLTGDHGLRVAGLVNDFGSITLDAELVVGVEGKVWLDDPNMARTSLTPVGS